MVWGAFGWPDASPEAVKSEDGSEADYPECDYDNNLTPLYEAIEERAWIAVNQFLHSGYWPESLFADKMSPEAQARTWVTRYETRADGSKKVRWSQLPIHAAVIFGAPSVVIQQLVEAFPQSVRCTDDHRMLPLHLAFRHGSDDSVLALFLDEFPEAVNVRGYKGRLPVECAKKGPNPERGAIIQTILVKNQTAWERKKSAVQLKELYCVKEALKIKSQKVSHLETAIREIKSREHKTRKELATTMTELKAAKIKSKDAAAANNDGNNAPYDDTAERAAVKQLVEKLAGLEMATKDLVEKERATKKELKKTMAELEATKKMKPTEDQAQQFAKLDKVASKESGLFDGKTDQPRDTKKSETKKSEKTKPPKAKKEVRASETDSKVSSLGEGSAPAIRKKEDTKEAENPFDLLKKAENLVKTFSLTGAKNEEEPKAKPVEKAASVPPADKIPAVTSSPSRELEKERLRKVEESNRVLEKKLDEVTTSASREMEKAKLRQVEKTNEALVNKIKELEATMEIYQTKQARAQEEFEAVSVPDENNRFTDRQTEQMAAIQAEMKVLKARSQKTQSELDTALSQLADLKKQQEAGTVKVKMDEETQATNKKLEKKVALLELALKQFEDKSTMAKEEMSNIQQTMKEDSTVKLTKAQEKHMGLLEAAMKKLEKNSAKTKKELDSALAELSAIKAKEAEAAEKKAAAENAKLLSMEQANKQLEDKIANLEVTMKGFEEKASKTKEEMDQALEELKSADLKASDTGTVASSGDGSVKLTKRQKQQMEALELSMKKLEDRATNTKAQLDQALQELADLKKNEEATFVNNQVESKKESKAMKDLAKKVQALQSAMVGFEVKETKTMQDLEKTMRELEVVSNKRFEVLAMTTDRTSALASDPSFTREVAKLEKKAAKEERRIAELEEAVQDIITKGGNTKEELETAKGLLEDLQKKQDLREHSPNTKEEKEEVRQDKKLIKELTKRVSTLQTAVIGFEVKETKTMQELETTMKQLEELTSKRFEVLEKASAMKEMDTEKLVAAGALAEEKVAVLHSAMKELELNAAKTHSELEKTKLELESMKAANSEGMSRKIIFTQEGQIRELNEKITVLQQAVQGFEVKESKTMQELEQTMKQLEELSAKRFEVLQKVAGREIEAAKTAEANKYSKKAAEEEKKVAALEFAMRELESKAYKTKLELERTMKGLEHLEEKQSVRQHEVAGVTKEEKRVMRELVSKVADIQEAVMAYDEKEYKTTQELERTRQELEATKKEVLDLRAQQAAAATEKRLLDTDINIVATDDNQSQVEAVEASDAVEPKESKEATETAKRVTEETLTSLETAIHRLVEQINTEDEDEVTKSAAGKLAAAISDLEDKKKAPSSVKPAPQQPVAKNLVQAAKEAKAERRRSSFFGRLSGKGKKEALPPKPPKEKKQKDKKQKQPPKEKKSGGFFSSLRRSSKASKPEEVAQLIAETEPEPVAAPPTPVVTDEQRKAVEAVHGKEITALLTAQQVLDLLSKMKEAPAADETTATTSAAAASESEKVAPLEKVTSLISEKSAAKSTGSNASVHSSGLKEEDPNMMIVSLPSQRSEKSAKSVGSGSQKSGKSGKSQRSGKSGSAKSSQLTVPTSPGGRRTVSPVPTDTATGKKATESLAKKDSDVLVTAGTYDDGFEINF